MIDEHGSDLVVEPPVYHGCKRAIPFCSFLAQNLFFGAISMSRLSEKMLLVSFGCRFSWRVKNHFHISVFLTQGLLSRNAIWEEINTRQKGPESLQTVKKPEGNKHAIHEYGRCNVFGKSPEYWAGWVLAYYHNRNWLKRPVFRCGRSRCSGSCGISANQLLKRCSGSANPFASE